MKLIINPQYAGAALLTMRDTTLSIDNERRKVACLPYFVNRKAEWLPEDMAAEYAEIWEYWQSPMLTVHFRMPTKGGYGADKIDARVMRMIWDNRPPMYPADNAPIYFGGVSSPEVGEPSLMLRGYPGLTRDHKYCKIDIRMPLVAVQQKMLCCGVRQVRKGGMYQDSITGGRQNKEGAIINAVVPGFAVQLAMLRSPENHGLKELFAYSGFELYDEYAWYNDSPGMANENSINWGTPFPDIASSNTADEPKISALNDRFWNNSAGIVAPHVKRGRFRKKETFVNTASERDVDRREWNGSFGFNDEEMKNTLKDIIDECGYQYSIGAGNVVPVSSTVEDAVADDTPANDLMITSFAASKVMQDAICRTLNMLAVSNELFYREEDDILRQLWFADPARRQSDRELQELKLRLIADSDDLVSLATSLEMDVDPATMPGGQTITWSIEGGQQLGENATAANTSSLTIEWLGNSAPNNAFTDHNWHMLAGMPRGLNRDAFMAESPRGSISGSPNADGSHQATKTCPMFGTPGFNSDSWDQRAQGIVRGPDYLLRDWNGGSTAVGRHSWIGCRFGLVWSSRDLEPHFALTAMGSIIPVKKNVIQDNGHTCWPWAIAGDALNVAALGVAGVFEDAVRSNAKEWDSSDGDDHFIGFFTNSRDS